MVLLIVTMLLFPMLYLTLELPKQIINGAIASGTDRIPVLGVTFTQIEYLMLLCAGFLGAVLAHGLLKMRINTMKGVLAERLLRRFRYSLIARILRFPQPYFERTSQGELVSMVTAESEPMGGLMGDALAQPVLQAGQMLTILGFLFAQSFTFGLAACALVSGCGGSGASDEPTTRSGSGELLYEPLIGAVPTPNDLAFQDSEDGTVNASLATPAGSSEPLDSQVSINSQDGFSTLASSTATFTVPVDGDTVTPGSTVRVFAVTTDGDPNGASDPGPKVVTGVAAELTAGTDFTAGLSPADPNGTTLSVTPPGKHGPGPAEVDALRCDGDVGVGERVRHRDRAMTAPRTADPHREVGLALLVVERKQEGEEVPEAAHQGRTTVVLEDVLRHLGVPARALAQAGLEVGVRQEAHVEEELRGVRRAVAEAEGDDVHEGGPGPAGRDARHLGWPRRRAHGYRARARRRGLPVFLILGQLIRIAYEN